MSCFIAFLFFCLCVFACCFCCFACSLLSKLRVATNWCFFYNPLFQKYQKLAFFFVCLFCFFSSLLLWKHYFIVVSETFLRTMKIGVSRPLVMLEKNGRIFGKSMSGLWIFMNWLFWGCSSGAVLTTLVLQWFPNTIFEDLFFGFINVSYFLVIILLLPPSSSSSFFFFFLNKAAEADV